MKKILVQTASSACIMFTFVMAWFLIMGYLFAGPSSGLNIITSVYGAAVGLAILQSIWFTDVALKRLSYPARIAGFGICALPVLALCAWFGRWLPVDQPSAWILFVIIYLFILAGMTAGYTIYFKKTVGTFDAALERYHQQQRK